VFHIQVIKLNELKTVEFKLYKFSIVQKKIKPLMIDKYLKNKMHLKYKYRKTRRTCMIYVYFQTHY
jgi:hypothetical protein